MSVFQSLLSKKSVRQRICLGAGSAVYALLFSLGSQIDQLGFTSLHTSIVRFLFALPVALVALMLFFPAMNHLVLPPPRQKQASVSSVRQTLHTTAIFCLIFLCYVPMFLFQYPGSFTYDISDQAFQAASGNYDTFHPLLHTLFLQACLSLTNLLNSFERAAALCNVIQMAIVSWCFAMICASIRRRFPRWVCVVAVLFFCLYPSHAAFATTYTKDTMFSSFFALFMALAFEDILHKDLSPLHRIIQVLSGILACLLRNNMIYAFAAWLIILLLGRKPMRRMAFYALLIFVLAKVANNSLIMLTHATPGPVREMLSIPAQQIARVRLYNGEQLTQQERDRMDSFFKEVAYERYNPTIADAIKNNLSSEALTERSDEALQLWLTLGKRYPNLYLDAFLHTALPSLYPYSQYRVSPRYIEVGRCRAGLTNPYGLEQIKQPSRFTSIRDWLNEQIYYTGADHHPILRWLFNCGFIFWLLLLQLLYDLYTGNIKRVFLMLLPVMLWGTYLLGPVMQGRYLYPFICILPMFLLRSKSSPITSHV